MRILYLLAALFMLALPARAADPSLYKALTTHALEFTESAISISQNGTGPQIHVVRIHATEDIFIAIGVTPQFAAAATAVFVPGDTTEFFYIRATAAISVVRDSTDGIVYITEVEPRKIN